jgi:hypothetical protein
MPDGFQEYTNIKDLATWCLGKGLKDCTVRSYAKLRSMRDDANHVFQQNFLEACQANPHWYGVTDAPGSKTSQRCE